MGYNLKAFILEKITNIGYNIISSPVREVAITEGEKMILAAIIGLAIAIILALVIEHFPIVGILIIIGIPLLTFIGWLLEIIEGNKDYQSSDVYKYDTLPIMEEEDYDDFLDYDFSYLED